MLDVMVIGAGLAGLYTARLLNRAGISCAVLEARNRIGGRILTHDGFDLGPSWFWPEMQPAMAELIAELGLPAFPQASEGDVLFERMSREGPQRCQSYTQEPRSFRVVGGTATLVETIANSLPIDTVRLQTPVESLHLAKDGVHIGVRGEPNALHARIVVAALPPRLLARAMSFEPAQDDATMQRWRATATWMAPHAKFFALYDRAFWREAGLSGTAQSMVGPMPEIHDATTADGAAGLFGFLGVSADERAALGEGRLKEACLAQLVRMFGPAAASPRATLFKDWSADSCTATPDDRVASGHPVPSAAPWVTGAWAHRLVLAGSETSPVEPGYLAGAVVAARTALTAVRERLAP